jgi:nucleoside-diphosphate-sugar epimerase
MKRALITGITGQDDAYLAELLLDTTRITQLGWTPRVGLNEGIKNTYNWYLAQSELD